MITNTVKSSYFNLYLSINYTGAVFYIKVKKISRLSEINRVLDLTTDFSTTAIEIFNIL